MTATEAPLPYVCPMCAHAYELRVSMLSEFEPFTCLECSLRSPLGPVYAALKAILEERRVAHTRLDMALRGARPRSPLVREAQAKVDRLQEHFLRTVELWTAEQRTRIPPQ